MSYQLIGSGGIIDVAQLSQYEDSLGEGQRALLELDLRLPVSQGVANELESKLRQAGVEEVSVTAASPLLRIYFRKGFPWLAVIAATILSIVVLAVMIVGWRIFKEVVPEELQPMIGTAVIILLVVLGATLLVKRRVT